MEYIIGSVLIVIALIIVGLIMRKRIYDVVDRQESWKMAIMNRNVASELGRIKRLNLSGETQEKFESWKERWEHIITKELPDIEEYLFDAEEAADRYRFPSAKRTLRYVEQTLESIEHDINDMLEELDALMQSEETSRKEIEQIQPDIKALRKTLSQNRLQFGKAEARFDVELDDLEKELKRYFELTEAGDYSDAQQLVDEISSRLEALQTEMEAFPAIYKKCKHVLPDQLDELFNGIRDMKEKGYRVEHLGFEKEIHYYQRKLADCMTSLEKGDTSEVNATIPEVEERIDDMYQLLEKEALAKNYVETKWATYQETLATLETQFDVTKEEVETLKETYYFEDSDMEKYLSLDQSIGQLRKQLETLRRSLEEDGKAHSAIRAELENGFEELNELQEKHQDFKKRVQNLRKDEIEAKEKLSAMKNDLYDVKRKLNKSNIPGVPGFIWNKMDEASNKNSEVLKALEKQPLDMLEVQNALSEAESAVNDVIEQTEAMLDQAYLTERVIQYANRYRSQFPVLAGNLSEAERQFRSFEYDLALEQAAKAIEEVEPGALKRIEQFQKEAN